MALCRHADLNSSEAEQVKRAEYAANLATCLVGSYVALCRHADLTPEEARRVASAESANPAPLPAHQGGASRTAIREGGHSGCEDGHYIDSVMDDGALIKLQDGSLWKVDETDAVDSSVWTEASEIVVCDGKLINTDDNETVQAMRIHGDF